MALHWYDTDPQNLIDYVTHWHEKYGKPIVITEFACQVSIFGEIHSAYAHSFEF